MLYQYQIFVTFNLFFTKNNKYLEMEKVLYFSTNAKPSESHMGVIISKELW
jgi:hypothetical protein